MSFKRNSSIRKSMGTWITGTWIRHNPRVFFSKNEDTEKAEASPDTTELKDEMIDTPIIVIEGEESSTDKEQPVEPTPTTKPSKRSGSNKCVLVLAVISLIITLIAIGLSSTALALAQYTQFSQSQNLREQIIDELSQPEADQLLALIQEQYGDQLLASIQYGYWLLALIQQYGDQLTALLSQIHSPVNLYSNCTEEVTSCYYEVSRDGLWRSCTTPTLLLDSTVSWSMSQRI